MAKVTRNNPIVKYTPKAIPGQPIKGYRKISKFQAEKCIIENHVFEGFFVGNKVASFHFFGGWYLAIPVSYDTIEDFHRGYNSMRFHLEPELGSGVAIYWKEAL